MPTPTGARAPTTASLGADPAALEGVASAMRAAAARLRSLPAWAPSAGRASWVGPDADRLRHDLTRLDRDRTGLVDALAACARRLDGAAVQQRSASLTGPTVQVPVDSAGDGGRLVQVLGSAGAPVVVVLVPGVGTDPGDRDRLRADAVRVWRALAAEVDDPGAVAVVSWLGYDPPDVVPGAVDPRPAAEGATALAREVGALRAGGATRVTVVGHSYGAVVAGRAAADGMGADVLVQLGAPGVGRPGATSRIAARHVTHVAAREDDDPIALVPLVAGRLYGEDPVGRVPALPTSGRGHGAYLRDPVLLAALADLAVGPGQPVRSPPWESPWTPQTASPRS